MEPASDSKICLFCTCAFTSNGTLLPDLNPQVMSIQTLKLTVKIQSNGYSWMRKSGFIWLDVKEFIKLYPLEWKSLIGRYSQYWLNRITRRVDHS